MESCLLLFNLELELFDGAANFSRFEGLLRRVNLLAVHRSSSTTLAPISQALHLFHAFRQLLDLELSLLEIGLVLDVVVDEARGDLLVVLIHDLLVDLVVLVDHSLGRVHEFVNALREISLHLLPQRLKLVLDKLLDLFRIDSVSLLEIDLTFFTSMLTLSLRLIHERLELGHLRSDQGIILGLVALELLILGHLGAIQRIPNSRERLLLEDVPRNLVGAEQLGKQEVRVVP